MDKDELSETFVSREGVMFQNNMTNTEEELMFFPDGCTSYLQNPTHELAIVFIGDIYKI